MKTYFKQHLHKPVALMGLSNDKDKRFFTEKYGAKLTTCPYNVSVNRKPIKITSIKCERKYVNVQH